MFHANKTLFYADRDHLVRFGRTITGDIYYAMDDGPVPTNAYNIARRKNQFVSADILAYAEQRLAVDESSNYVRLTAKSDFDDSSFSRTDIECLQGAIEKYASMEMLKLWSLVHKEVAWKENYRGSGTSAQIPIEDLVPKDIPEREKIVAQLKEHSTYTEL